MTRAQIVEGLAFLILQLANNIDVPDGWTPHEWFYVKGVASGELMRLRDRLAAGEPS